MRTGGAEEGHVPLGKALQSMVQGNTKGFREDFAPQEGERAEAHCHTPALDKPHTRQRLVDKMAIV